MHDTYVLLSHADGRFYIGSTNDLRRPFKLHNDGQVSSTTYRRL